MLKWLQSILSPRGIPSILSTVFGALCALAVVGNGATLSVTPSAVSSTYAGVLTLQITGLTNGEQVIIQKYLDLNTNGTVDAGESLLDTFRIRDGAASTIAGVTNINVPYDSNSATGAITTTLSFALPLESFIGRQVFRLVSPFGNFSPQSALFTVTNAALAQSVTGTVFNGASPVPNAIVVVLSQPNNNFITAAVADNAGHYVIKLNPGTYGLFPTFVNYYTDQSIAALVTLTNGASATANLFLTNGLLANTVSGRTFDATNASAVGGVFLQLESGNLFAIAFTDTNGNYSAALAPASWRVRPEDNRLARTAYVGPQSRLQVNLTTGSVANANFALPKADALFYGRITDNLNVPFANISFFGNDDIGQFKASGFSDANGNYVVAVLGGSQWNSAASSDENDALSGYIVSNGLGTTNIFSGQAVRQDFVAVRATAQITGYLRDNLGNPVTGVSINGNATIGGTPYNTSAITDNSGNYSLSAGSGAWFLTINCCGNEGLESRGLVDLAFQHVISIPPTNAVLNITVYPIGTPLLSQPARFSPTQFGFNLSGAVGSNYTIQASTNLTISNWFNLFSISLTNNAVFLEDNQATNNRFYRARKN